MIPFTLPSPAKINLYLHITGKRDDGFHLLDSGVTFAKIGDELHFETATSFLFHVNGPYAAAFSEKDLNAAATSHNLVVKAAHSFSKATGCPLNVKITLTKNLPLGSGIGGGSSNAATTLEGLSQFWDIKDAPLYDIAKTLGSDVAVCLSPHTLKLMQGIGELISPLPLSLPPLAILLVNPNIPCPTAAVYKTLRLESYTQPLTLETSDSPIDFLKNMTRNDMTEAAINIVPEITDVLKCLSEQRECLLARLSGSGATCFGLFSNKTDCITAENNIRAKHPNWWIKTTICRN